MYHYCYAIDTESQNVTTCSCNGVLPNVNNVVLLSEEPSYHIFTRSIFSVLVLFQTDLKIVGYASQAMSAKYKSTRSLFRPVLKRDGIFHTKKDFAYIIPETKLRLISWYYLYQYTYYRHTYLLHHTNNRKLVAALQQLVEHCRFVSLYQDLTMRTVKRRHIQLPQS